MARRKALDAAIFGVAVPAIEGGCLKARGIEIDPDTTAGPGDPFKLAPALGMPAWKVKRARTQAHGWTEAGLQHALGIVATLNADVKGAAADPAYALESAVRRVAAARIPRR